MCAQGHLSGEGHQRGEQGRKGPGRATDETQKGPSGGETKIGRVRGAKAKVKVKERRLDLESGGGRLRLQGGLTAHKETRAAEGSGGD